MANVRIPPFTEAPSTVVGGTPQSVFPFEFPFWSTNDILVYQDGVLVDAADYTVAGLAIQSSEAVEGGFGSGTVTFDVAVSSCTITIDRQVVGDRQTQFSRTIPLDMRALNGDLNRVTARQQDLDRRKVTRPAGDRAGLYLAFDADGLETASAGTGADGALRADLAAAAGASLLGFSSAGSGAVLRSSRTWTRERPVSVKDFGALGDGTTNDTAAVLAAYAAGHYDLYFPPGTYRLGQVGLLGAAGMRIRGAGRGVNGLLTTIKPIASMTAGQAIFYNQAASPATSSFITIEDITFDLNSQNCVGIDLDRISNANVNRCHFKGATTLGTAAGVGIQYRATTASGSYTNAATQCSFEALAKGVEFATDANSCSVFGGEFINCTIGADCGPAGALDTPRIFGARFEGCNVGIRERSTGANYFGCRFEASTGTDIDFIAGSDRPMVVGGYTATTATPLRTVSNAVSPIIMAPDMGRYDLEASTAPKYSHGRQVFAARNTATPPTTPNLEYCTYFHDIPMIRNQVAFEGVNAAGTNSVVIFSVDGSNRVTLSGLDRATGTYLRMFLGENWSVFGTGLDYAGVQVLGARNTGWTAMTGTGSKGALAAAAAGTASAAYAQAELQGALNRIAALEARLKSYDDALTTHGLIGA